MLLKTPHGYDRMIEGSVLLTQYRARHRAIRGARNDVNVLWFSPDVMQQRTGDQVVLVGQHRQK